MSSWIWVLSLQNKQKCHQSWRVKFPCIINRNNHQRMQIRIKYLSLHSRLVLYKVSCHLCKQILFQCSTRTVTKIKKAMKNFWWVNSRHLIQVETSILPTMQLWTPKATTDESRTRMTNHLRKRNEYPSLINQWQTTRVQTKSKTISATMFFRPPHLLRIWLLCKIRNGNLQIYNFHLTVQYITRSKYSLKRANVSIINVASVRKDQAASISISSGPMKNWSCWIESRMTTWKKFSLSFGEMVLRIIINFLNTSKAILMAPFLTLTSSASSVAIRAQSWV